MPTLSPLRYPHMIDLKPAANAGLTVLRVTDGAVTVVSAADQKQTDISWRDLIAAAEQKDEDLRAVYAAVHVIAAKRLQQLLRRQQGLSVSITDRGTNAMWEAVVSDASGRERRDLMRADEGMQQPHKWMAEQEAAKIRTRLKI